MEQLLQLGKHHSQDFNKPSVKEAIRFFFLALKTPSIIEREDIFMTKNYERRAIIEKLNRIERIVERNYYDDKMSYFDFSDIRHELDDIRSDIESDIIVDDVMSVFSAIGKILKQ